MAIELRLLRYFAVVAEELHVGNAAARLFISQPALSQQIRVLEEQVGLPLFIRHPRGVELSEAGEVLRHEARAVLRGSEQLEGTVEELRRGRIADLRIIKIRTAAAWRAANRSPLLETLVGLLPRAAEPDGSVSPRSVPERAEP